MGTYTDVTAKQSFTKKSGPTLVDPLLKSFGLGNLGFLSSGGLVGSFVHELKQLGATVIRGERVARLLSGLGLADHLDLADICIRYVDV